MNSQQIQANIENLKARILDTEARLRAALDVDTGLALQRELSDLQSYLTRLQTQLDTALREEDTAKKEREANELETELAELTAHVTDLKGDMAHLLRDQSLGLDSLYATFKPLHAELIALDIQHEKVFYRRHHRYPGERDALLGSRVVFVPAGIADDTEAVRITALALELLHHERIGHGYKLQDVYRGLQTATSAF